jgi:phosphoribosylaminoimidazolecarboxamide formyltransferase/IMP cyclohydrolase
VKVSTALISVFDKTGVVDFARGLHELGVRILSSGGTARALRDADVPVTEVSEHTGSPEIMDGRVKTLHPKIHGGILGVRDSAEHLRQATEQGIAFIDLVAVNLYPFEKVTAKPAVTMEEAVENIDIGGPAMVRSAAKNHRYVTIVTEPSDYGQVLEELRENEGRTTETFRRLLAVKAFAHTARYDGLITSFLGGGGELPGLLTLQYERVQQLRYGENPHQKAAFYRARKRTGASVAFARVLGGKELSYNNLLDLDSAFELAREFAAPSCVVVKHNNPCGTAQAEPLVEAFRKAREGDPVSAFGGIVAFNVPVDAETAGAMATKDNFFEAVVAPSYEEGAPDILRTKTRWGKNLRILEAEGDLAGASGRELYRGIRDGMLVQTADGSVVAEMKAVCGELTDALRDDLLFAMTVCKHVRSNAIVITQGRQLVGVGAGQMSRVDSSGIAVKKAGDRTKGAVAASDAFFPFPDALEVLIRAGVTAVVHPGGSVRDKEVAETAKKAGITLVLSGQRHFRH